MRKIGFMLFFASVCFCAKAQYVSPGNGLRLQFSGIASDTSSTLRSVGNGSFEVLKNITISTSDTLVLDEGTKHITLHNAVRWEVRGVLLCAERTDTLFISGRTDSTGMEAFTLAFEQSPSQLSQLYVENGKSILLNESPVRIERCVFRNFSAAVLRYTNCNPVITHCLFTGNHSAALTSAANVSGSPKILYNIFYNNVTGNVNQPQLNLGPGGEDSIYIIGNRIEGVSSTLSGGIAIADLLGTGDTKAALRDNFILNNRYGYNQQGHSIHSVIENNVFKNNNLETNPMNGGSGISIYGAKTSCAAKLRHNLICGNLWGITAIYYHDIDMGTEENPGQNLIYGNGNGGKVYALYNNGYPNISAIGNYWGSNHINEAEAVIFDSYDQSGLGTVSYIPVLTLEPVLLHCHALVGDSAHAFRIDGVQTDTLTYTLFVSDSLYERLQGEEKRLVLETPWGISYATDSAHAEWTDTNACAVYTLSTPHGERANWIIQLRISANALPDMKQAEVRIYPNPSKTHCLVRHSGEGTLLISVYTPEGRCLYKRQATEAETRIETAQWPRGIYLIRLQQGNTLRTEKLIVE